MHTPLFTAPERFSAAWSEALVGLVDWGLPLWIVALLLAIVVERLLARQRATVVRMLRLQREVEGGPYRGGLVDENVVAAEERPWRAGFWRRAGVSALFAILGGFTWLALSASRDLAEYRTLRRLGHTVEAPVFRVDEWTTGKKGCECRHYAVLATLPDGTIVRDLASSLGAHYAKLERSVPWTMGPDGLNQIGPVEELGIRVLPGAMVPFLLLGLMIGHVRAWRRVHRTRG